MAALKTTLTRIGNSQGIRIPKSIVEQLGLHKGVELEVKKDYLVVRAVKKPRQGWAEAAKSMNEAGDDQLLDPLTVTEFDDKEWTW
jgi:antitoxin MazE